MPFVNANITDSNAPGNVTTGSSGATKGSVDNDNPWSAPQTVQDATSVDASLTQSGGKRDLSRAILALADQGVCSATNFLTMAMIARSISTAAFGVFSLAFLFFQFARTIQERMLAAPYLVYTHRPAQDRRTLLGSNIVHQSVFALSTLAITVLAGAVLVVRGKPPGLGNAFLALAIAIPFLLLRDQLRAICGAHFKFGVSLAMNVAVAILQLGGIGWLIHKGLLSIPAVMVVLAIACLIPCAAWFGSRPQPFVVQRARVAKDWRTFWNYSRWLVLARSLGIGGQYLVPCLVAFYMDLASTGAFATCTSLVGLSMMFILGLNNFAQPRTVVAYQTHGIGAMLRTLFETVACFAVFLGGVAVLLFVFGDELLGVIYGPQYIGFGQIAALMALGMLTVSVSIACQNGLAALGKPHGYLWGETSYFVTAVALALLLIPRWGLEGAALALVIAGVVVSVVTIATLFVLVGRDREKEGNESAHADALTEGL